jgi:HPt (histidine-containing phosphotransfer) domain-containing protein
MLGNDEESLKEVVSIFLEDGPPMVKSLEESVRLKDYDMIKRTSHTLITELSTVGITSVVPDLKRMNKTAKEMNDLDEVMEHIKDVVDRSVQFFKSMD